LVLRTIAKRGNFLPPGLAIDSLSESFIMPGGELTHKGDISGDPLIGQILDGRYEIVEPIGKGSMGVVYRARQLSVERDVAVKVLLPEILNATLSKNASERFQKEARIISKLRHPNTVKLFDFGQTADGRFYLVMEFLQGKPLDSLLEEGPLDQQRTLSILSQIADALTEAHKNGIVHRDLKPSNIFVDRIEDQEVVKVLDFGIAKSTGEPMKTGTGAVIGSPAYMSPEQAQGESLDAATDVYSLGVLGYHCLTGQPPFYADSAVGILLKHVNEEPAPLTEIEISKAVETLIMGMLSKDPDQRPATASEVQRAIADLDKQPDDKAKPKSEPVPLPRVRWNLAAALIGLAGLIIIAVIFFLSQSKPYEERHKKPASVKVSQLTEQPGLEQEPTFSPNGKFIAYSGNAAGNFDIYLLRVGGDRPINLTEGSKADERWPAFSPDGEQIAFISLKDPSGLYVMGATGESKRLLADKAYNPAWSHDGKEIFYATELFGGPYDRAGTSTLWAVDVESGARRQITESDAVQPDASPHGRRVAYWAVKEGQRDIWTIGIDGKNPVAVTQDVPTDYNPVWSPAGDYLYFLSDRSGTMNLWRVPINEASGQVHGTLEQLTSGSANMHDLAISKCGLMAYNNLVRSYRLKRVDFDAEKEEIKGEPVCVLKTSRAMASLDISPDSKFLAYYTRPIEDIAVVGRNGKNRRLLTKDVSFDRMPKFSPDGKSLAFYSNRSGSYDVWLVDTDGTGKRQLTDTKGDVGFNTWSPDGKKMAVVIFDKGIFTFDIPDGEPVANLTKLTDSNTLSDIIFPTSWSPDGRLLAGYTSGRAGSPASYIYSFENNASEVIAGDCSYPVWLSDSKRLLVQKERKLVLVDIKTKRQKGLLQLPEGIFFSDFAISADDSEIFFTEAQFAADIWLLRVE
jgi:serine/threonine protein kinase